VFACVAKPPSTIAPVPGADPKFTRLTNLKKLLDDRVITQQEFDSEKAKVLASP
jgi:hypothetical protein